MKKILLILVIVAGLLFGTIAGAKGSEKLNFRQLLLWHSRPNTVKIPDIDVEAKVEWVGEDNQGNMDIPKDTDNAAWYEKGYYPGEKGSMVIAGHKDSKTGPAIFYNLDKLSFGDAITVSDMKGKIYRYIVFDKKLYEEDMFPVKEIFGKTDFSILNLITCKGTFNRSDESYSHRLVVSAKLVE